MTENLSEEQYKTVQISTDAVQVASCSKCGCEVDVSSLQSFSSYTCPQCGSDETVPAKLGHFLLLNLIGTGGMGGVYRAMDESLGRMVAIKVMLKSLGDDPKFIETFQREAQAAAKLNHPNIAQIYSFGKEKGQPYIVMEHISGGSLDKMISPKKPADQALVMRVGYEITQGLWAADEAGLIHGDIKPENILFDEKLNSKLVDFGLASYANQSSADGIWGTPYYIAPEKLKKQKVDARSDIYSLGATLYHAVTGIPPFDGKTPLDVVKARLKRPPVSVSVARKGLDPIVEQVIMRMLESDLGKRYPNYNSLVSDLKKAVDILGDDRKISKTQKKLRVKSSSTTNIPDASGSSGTRMIIKKTTTSSIPELSKYKPTHTTSSSPAGGSIPSVPKRKSLAGLWVTMGIILLLVAGAGVAVMAHNKKLARIASQNSMAIQEQQKKADEISGQIKTCINGIFASGEKVKSLVSSARQIAGGMLGEHVIIRKRDPAQSGTENTGRGLKEPEIKLLAGDVLGYEDLLKENVRDVKLLMSATENIEKDVAGAKTPSEAGQKVKDLENNLASARTIEKKVADNIKAMEDIIARMSEIRDREKQGQTATANEEKRRREEEARRIAEQERLAVTEREKTEVRSAVETARDLVKQNRFKDAMETVKNQTGNLQTAEAQAQAKLAMERLARIYQLFQFAGKTISEKQFPKGWVDGAPQGIDITGATQEYLMVGGKKVEWTKASATQMLRIIDHSLQKSDVKGSQLADYYLSTAVYCREVEGEDAGPIVSKYRDLAVKYFPRLQAEADRLLKAD